MVLAGAHVAEAAEAPVDFKSVRERAVYTPMPELYREWLTNAWSVVHMVVDPATGRVTNAYVAESSGDSHLNYRLVKAFRRWKFLPGTPKLIRVTFGTVRVLSDAFPSEQRQRKPVDDILTPFLGKGTVVQGELPEYPSTPRWTNKRGTGVFVIHVDRNGTVSDVTIKRSSGDAPFDRVTVQALRQWRFRRGPIKIELPLSFVLTPSKFSLHLPKHR